LKPQLNLQDKVLNLVKREKIVVTIYLVNGFQLKGYVSGFDNFTIILNSDGRNQMVYKHAISTITSQEMKENLFEKIIEE
jgi:host factor-I protein